MAVGRAVELSVRPEAVALQITNGSGPSDARGSIAASVVQVAYLGGSVQYLVRSAGGLTITVLVPKTGERIPIGGAVDITWSPGDALVLAEASAQEEAPA